MRILQFIEAHPYFSICAGLSSGAILNFFSDWIHSAIDFLIGLFWVRRHAVDRYTGAVIYDYLNAVYKGFGVADETYEAKWEHVRPLEDEYSTWYRNKGYSTRLWFKGIFPIILWPSGKDSVSGDSGAPVFRYLRWTVNWDKLIKAAGEHRDKKLHLAKEEKGHKFKIIKHTGTGSRIMTPDGDSGKPSDTANNKGYSFHSENDLLFWKPEDIGNPRPDDPIGFLSINEAMAKVIKRVKFWFNDKDWYKERGLIWKLGILLHGKPGGGKCLGKGTPVLMYDGSIKSVEDVKVGDKLMGPDSKPRNVLGTTIGYDELFRVTPVKGDAYVVNKDHILSLSFNDKIVNLSVREWLKKNQTFKERAKGWRVGVEFNEQPVPMDPYLLGLWLGDGTKNKPDITTSDSEILHYLQDSATSMNLSLNGGYKTGNANTWCFSANVKTGRSKGASNNKFRNDLYNLNVWNNKHIPDIYKINSRFNRLQLLAGLLDTDGHMHHNFFEIVQKNERLANDIVFLARSLGFAAYIRKVEKTCTNSATKATGYYYRITISGHVGEIPVKIGYKKAGPRKQIKNVLHTGIEVHSIGPGDYFGFELDGDGLFLLGDFTVTHNTSLIRALAEELDIPMHVFDLPSLDNYEFTEAWQSSQSDKPRIVVFEDWDTVFHGRKNMIADSNLDLSTILNLIDGVEREHGLLLFITTNKVQYIDEAIGAPREDDPEKSTRPGRIDMCVKLEALDKAGREKIANRILKDRPEIAKEMVTKYAKEGAVQFQDRCIVRALELYWEEKQGKAA